MVSKSISNIFKEFDETIELLKNDELTKKQITSTEGDLNLLNLWRKEIESDKQSVFIVGKTSTGKSEFHNLLLDIDIEAKEEKLFKTSTKVETGIIQTLQHCNKREDAYAELKICNGEEFKKLEIPQDLSIKFEDKKIIIPFMVR